MEIDVVRYQNNHEQPAATKPSRTACFLSVERTEAAPVITGTLADEVATGVVAEVIVEVIIDAVTEVAEVPPIKVELMLDDVLAYSMLELECSMLETIMPPVTPRVGATFADAEDAADINFLSVF